MTCCCQSEKLFLYLVKVVGRFTKEPVVGKNIFSFFFSPILIFCYMQILLPLCDGSSRNCHDSLNCYIFFLSFLEKKQVLHFFTHIKKNPTTLHLYIFIAKYSSLCPAIFVKTCFFLRVEYLVLGIQPPLPHPLGVFCQVQAAA